MVDDCVVQFFCSLYIFLCFDDLVVYGCEELCVYKFLYH